jgi:hypothetical protein
MATVEEIRECALVLAEAETETDQAAEQILASCGSDFACLGKARRSLPDNRALAGDAVVTLALRYLDAAINRRLWD